MANKEYNNKYWENEESEIVKFEDSFIRCFDEAGKLQFGKIITDKKTKEEIYLVKFVIDREVLLGSDEGADFLLGVIESWKEMQEG